jgi:cysteine desulfurase
MASANEGDGCDREVYLDWNATTPIHPSVAAAMRAAGRSGWANPSSVHTAGRRARAMVEGAREAVAACFEFHPRDVVFTAGGTEANNLALSGASALITSRIEHPSVTRVAESLEARGVPVRWLPIDEQGVVQPASVAEALASLPSGSVVAVMAVNHESGVIQPIEAIAEIAHAADAWLHVDTVQAVGKLPPSTWSGADSVALAAHKIRGPKGVGVLAWRPAAPPRPVVLGGAQERGIRPGTQDAVAIEGLRVAVERAASGPARYAELARLRDRFEAELVNDGLAEINGLGALRAAHVSNLFFPGRRGDELVVALDLLGVHVSSGSACSAGTQEASSAVAAMSGADRAKASLRVSLGEETTDVEIDAALRAFRTVLSRS